MWVEELRLQNIKCFEDVTIPLGENGKPYKWVTFLSENGGGKTTALQALGLLLVGRTEAQILVPRPNGLVRNGSSECTMSTDIILDESDEGFGETERDVDEYKREFKLNTSGLVVKRFKVNRLGISRRRENTKVRAGHFSAGYGAFRRLKRTDTISFQPNRQYDRSKNFQTQFNENDPLRTFDDWMFELDYRISKTGDEVAKRFQDISVSAINQLLPIGAGFDQITNDGQINFNINGVVVPTLSLSDGYRSVMALAGDLVYRMIQAFPNYEHPLRERGVVLIDELDIHLHPKWQREIPGLLRKTFPNIQFIVATHSPLIAAGADENAVAYRFEMEDGKAQVRRIDNLAFKSVDNVLTSDAFGLVSPFSPQAQEKIDEYDELADKGSKRTAEEQKEFEELRELLKRERPFRKRAEPGSLEARIDAYLDKTLK